jgi:hypothetical protein
MVPALRSPVVWGEVGSLPVLSVVEGSVVSKPVLSTVERVEPPVVSEVEPPVLSEVEGFIAAQ